MDKKIVKDPEITHIDPCGPSQIKSIGVYKYIIVIFDDFSRFI